MEKELQRPILIDTRYTMNSVIYKSSFKIMKS